MFPIFRFTGHSRKSVVNRDRSSTLYAYEFSENSLKTVFENHQNTPKKQKKKKKPKKTKNSRLFPLVPPRSPVNTASSPPVLGSI